MSAANDAFHIDNQEPLTGPIPLPPSSPAKRLDPPSVPLQRPPAPSRPTARQDEHDDPEQDPSEGESEGEAVVAYAVCEGYDGRVQILGKVGGGWE